MIFLVIGSYAGYMHFALTAGVVAGAGGGIACNARATYAYLDYVKVDCIILV